jgi:hypothetical protein
VYRVKPFTSAHYQPVFDMVYEGTLEPWTTAYMQV